MRLATLILTPVVLLCSFLQAQEHDNFSFRHIDQSDGLLHNNLIALSQDAKGFVWILTNNGLQRYDGSRFVNYDSSLNEPSGGRMEGGELDASRETDEVRILRKNKLTLLNLHNNRFTNYDDKCVWQDTADGFTRYIDEHGHPWDCGPQGIFQLSDDAKQLINSILNVYPFTDHHSCAIKRDALNKQLWMVDGTIVTLFDDQTHKIYSTLYNPVHHPLLSFFDSVKTNLRMMMIDRHHNYWLGSWGNNFFKYNSATGAIKAYDLSAIRREPGLHQKIEQPLLLNAFYEDRQGSIWLATENAGLFLYRPATDDFENIIVDRNNTQSVQYNFKINCIMQDKEDNIWLGTDKGISVFNPYSSYFTSIQHLSGRPSLPDNEILNLTQTKNGDILIGTWGGGMALYDAQYRFKQNLVFPAPFDRNKVWCFITQEDGNIWAGCQHGYIHIYDPQKQTLKTLHPPELENSTVRCMIKDSAGNTWFGLHNGRIAMYSKSSHRFYPANNSLPDSNAAAPVLKIFIDKQQQFWITTEAGMKHFDPVTRKYKEIFLPDKKNPDAINAISTLGIDAVNDTTLVIGTAFGGLNMFNTQTRKFSHVALDGALGTGTIYAVKKDNDGFVWFTTDYHLYKFKPGSTKAIQFNLPPGMIKSSFNSIDFFTLQNGSWLTASTTEIISFQPGAVAENKLAANEQVEVTGLKIFDKAIFIDSFLTTHRAIELSYKQNFINIEFALLNFSSLQQVKYAYMLSNVNKDWVVADRSNASYTNLPPGTYTFLVKAVTGTGSTKETSLVLIIKPPFWQTWWFKLLCLTALITIVWLLISRRIKTIRQQAQMKQRIAETEMMALRAQMNPHFIFNCLNSIDNLIQVGDKDKATIYLSKFAKLIRFILENSRYNIVPCWKDIETLKLYLELESLRFGKKFTYQLDIEPDVLNGGYKVPPLVIQPFVENAIHHGLLNKTSGENYLLVKVYTDHFFIHYIIEDNGVGRQQSAMVNSMNKPGHESMGMQITTDRIHLFNKHGNGAVKVTDLYAADGMPCGTRVEVRLTNQS